MRYYNYKHLTDQRKNMLIHKALLKYGYSNFSLEILEYCNKNEIVVREQHYIDILKPEYNILTKKHILLLDLGTHLKPSKI